MQIIWKISFRRWGSIICSVFASTSLNTHLNTDSRETPCVRLYASVNCSQCTCTSHKTHEPWEKLVFLLQASFIPFLITSSSRSELITATSPTLFFLARFPLPLSPERRFADMLAFRRDGEFRRVDLTSSRPPHWSSRFLVVLTKVHVVFHKQYRHNGNLWKRNNNNHKINNKTDLWEQK